MVFWKGLPDGGHFLFKKFWTEWVILHTLCKAGIQEPGVVERFCLNICLLFCVSGVINLLAGKQVIHPNQIAVVQEQFSPSAEKIKWAEELIAAFKEHQQLGKVNVLKCPEMVGETHV